MSTEITPDKLFAPSLLDQLSAEESAVIVDAMVEFDGNVTSTGTRRYYSSRPELMGQFERLAVQAGYSVSRRRERNSPGASTNYFVTISRKRSVTALSVAGGMTIRNGHRNVMRMEGTNPSGEVWCCTVPSGVIVVRRNGLSMLCGNCAEAAALRRAFPEELGNELTAEEMIGRNVHDLHVDMPTITDQSAAASERDAAPPRHVIPQTEDARDGTPPPRETKQDSPPRQAPKKDDPISSGPQRTAPKKTADEVKPHRIPGDGHTFETWAAQFGDLVKTSPDTATVYRWIDENTKPFILPTDPDKKKQTGPLERLSKGKPSVYASVKKTIEETIEGLRPKQEPKKPAPKKDDMADDDDMADEPPNVMDEPGEPVNENIDYGKPADDNPETVLKWINGVLATAEDPADVETLWENVCQQYTVDMIPPDQDEATALVRRHEKRLEP